MKKEYFNIPNMMGYFRILLLPIFLYVYVNAESKRGLATAFCILGVSFLTDLLDGKIARRFHMVTDFGKVLDPIADKLTQGVLVLALTFYYPLAGPMIVVFLIKEAYMAVMGMVLIRKGHRINGAKWYGKLCTAFLDLVVFVLLLLRGNHILIANILMITAIAVMIFSLCCYLCFHIGILCGKQKETHVSRRKKVMFILLFIILMFVYVIAGAYLPYRRQPEVSTAYRENFQVSDYYKQTSADLMWESSDPGEDESFCDRALLIEDNGEALAQRVRLIEHAKERIVMSTFDIRADEAGMQVMAALQAAAKRGVHVQLLADGFNSVLHMSGNPYFYALASHDQIEIRIYNTVNPLLPWKGMSRMHDKYLIADDEVYILGGRNTFNYFLGDQDSHKNYDRDVLVFRTREDEESSVYELLDYFEKIWNLDCCDLWQENGLNRFMPSVKKAKKELDTLYESMREIHPAWFTETFYADMTMPVDRISLISGEIGLYSKEPRVFYALCRLMEDAKEEVCIHTPYIICNEMMYRELEAICGDGKSVTLMTNSVSNNGNPFGAVDYAIHKERILETGLHVLEYEGGISYHGKSITIDDHLSMIGSFNMDMKSVYQDTELMLVIDGREFTQNLNNVLEQYHQDAVEAVYTGTEMRELFTEDVSFKKKLQRRVVRLINPWARILM